MNFIKCVNVAERLGGSWTSILHRSPSRCVHRDSRQYFVLFSDAYNSHDLIYEWDHQNVRLARGIYLSQFDLISYPFRNATVQRKGAYNSAQ